MLRLWSKWAWVVSEGSSAGTPTWPPYDTTKTQRKWTACNRWHCQRNSHFYIAKRDLWPSNQGLNTCSSIHKICTEKCGFNLKSLIFQLILKTDFSIIFCKILLMCMSKDINGYKSTLVQVMAWCHQAPSHHLSQCRQRLKELLCHMASLGHTELIHGFRSYSEIHNNCDESDYTYNPNPPSHAPEWELISPIDTHLSESNSFCRSGLGSRRNWIWADNWGKAEGK